MDEVDFIEINAANISALAEEVANNTEQVQNNTIDIASILSIDIEVTTGEPPEPVVFDGAQRNKLTHGYWSDSSWNYRGPSCGSGQEVFETVKTLSGESIIQLELI